MQVTGRTFLITGGGSGLGAATARMLAQAGGHLVIADVSAAAGEGVAAELGPAAAFIRTDVTSEGDVQQAVALAASGPGGLHGVVNAAGIAIAERILAKTGPHPLDSFSRVVAVNLIGTFNVLRLASAAMMNVEPDDSGERGVIVNTASVAAYEGQIGQAAYSASKGGIVALTLPAARELARYGIRVMTIAPGVFDTPLVAGLPEPARQSLAQQVPFPSRFGRPEEYAALVRHIFENQMLNGSVIRLDGAIRMAPK